MLPLGPADQNRKGVLEAKRGEHPQPVALGVKPASTVPEAGPVAGAGARGLLEDRRPGRAGVFDVAIDPALAHGLMAKKGAAEAEFAPHLQRSVFFDLLGQQFTEQLLFGKTLGPDHHRAGRAWRGQLMPAEDDGKQGRAGQGRRQGPPPPEPLPEPLP